MFLTDYTITTILGADERIRQPYPQQPNWSFQMNTSQRMNLCREASNLLNDHNAHSACHDAVETTMRWLHGLTSTQELLFVEQRALWQASNSTNARDWLVATISAMIANPSEDSQSLARVFITKLQCSYPIG